ncbi:MAG: hypothetical protein HY234_09410 [Acidobacteria bacterium]|nr:hypothetical protein [Acidobacteriota bacterium]
MIKRILGVVAGVALIIGLIAVYNVWSWLSEGMPLIPRLEDRWWAGYYETTVLGRQWCLVRFVKAPSGRLQMVVLSAWGAPDTFDVDRSTSSESFVDLTFTDRANGVRIEAKQLYDGKRYYLGSLMVRRFRDFWKMNDDVSIRGHFAATSPEREFVIEPLADEKVSAFWGRYVRPDRPQPPPNEVLRAAGVAINDYGRKAEQVR